MSKFRRLIDRTPPEELAELAELFTDARIGAGGSAEAGIPRPAAMSEYDRAINYIAERVLQVS